MKLPTKPKPGWVPFPRTLLRSAVYRSGPFAFYLWMYLYSRARWKPGSFATPKGKVDLDVGQLVVGVDQLAKDLSAPRFPARVGMVKSALKRLVDNGSISLKADRNGTIITICGYADLVRVSGGAPGTRNQLRSLNKTQKS